MSKKFKSAYSNRVVPPVVGEKYQEWDGKQNLGFISGYTVTELSFVIRAAMFGIRVDNDGKILVKEFRDMTSVEYEWYTECFEEVTDTLRYYSARGE